MVGEVMALNEQIKDTATSSRAGFTGTDSL
jgi:hypothetical protein